MLERTAQEALSLISRLSADNGVLSAVERALAREREVRQRTDEAEMRDIADETQCVEEQATMLDSTQLAMPLARGESQLTCPQIGSKRPREEEKGGDDDDIEFYRDEKMASTGETQGAEEEMIPQDGMIGEGVIDNAFVDNADPLPNGLIQPGALIVDVLPRGSEEDEGEVGIDATQDATVISGLLGDIDTDDKGKLDEDGEEEDVSTQEVREVQEWLQEHQEERENESSREGL